MWLFWPFQIRSLVIFDSLGVAGCHLEAKGGTKPDFQRQAWFPCFSETNLVLIVYRFFALRQKPGRGTGKELHLTAMRTPIEYHETKRRVQLAWTACMAHIRQSLGAYKTVKARFWPWLPGISPLILYSCSLFLFVFFITLKPRVRRYTKSMSLEFEPASKPLPISVK